MIITTLLGSPRKKGNTATILTAFEKLIPSHHTVNRLNIPARGVNGCLGCDACQKATDIPGCVQKDDIGEMLTSIFHSDVVVYASPVYVWDFTAQMKALIDRHYCFVKWKNNSKAHCLLEGKPTLLLTTCGGDADTNTDLIREIFKREMDYLHCRIIGAYCVPNCTTPPAPGKAAQQTARLMADDIRNYGPV
ncbi:MAG: flavodoxin family protein [Spirochaetales bacterium]|nr:flavodoxin family protein [Spirochaetales bacterium]